LPAEVDRLASVLGSARKALVIGIGGGGDIVGALATARLCEELGTEVVMGGVAWERLPIDPYPGPRPVREIVDARPLAGSVVLAGPQTRTAGGTTFAEAHMASFLDQETLLIDILDGPETIASSLAAAAELLGADLVVGVDVGGDVLGDGSEPGLASPLCDAVMLAATARLGRRGLKTLAAVFGPCCDGELTIDEILDRLAVLASRGALVGARGISAGMAQELEEVTKLIPTEASAQAIRCARREMGVTTIRRGRRQVVLSPVGSLTFYFDPEQAVASVASLARAVIDARDLEHANDLLHDLGVATELDFERSWTEA
jgi:hypothetical protein